MNDKTQLSMLGATNLVRVPGLLAQPKPGGAGQLSISAPYKVLFPSGKGVVRAIRVGALKTMTRDMKVAALSCLSLRVQVDGERDLFTTGQGEGYAVFESIPTWFNLKDIPYTSASAWTLFVQNEDDFGSANASYFPWVELAIAKDA